MALPMLFLGNELQHPYTPKPRELVGGRFKPLYTEGRFRDEARTKVHDEACPGNDHVLTTIGTGFDGGQRARNFLLILERFQNDRTFPRLVSTFNVHRFAVIVTTGLDENFQRVLSRSNWVLTLQNSVRLCHRLFSLLEKFHAGGYVHRHIDPFNIRAGIDWSGEFSVQLNGFEYSAPIDPPPHSFGMSRWLYQSRFVNQGQPYNRIDDYFAALFVVMRTQDVPLFQDTPYHSTIQKKLDFEDHPEAILGHRNRHWIWRLYEELMDQRANGFNRAAIFQHLETAIPELNPASPFDWHYVRSTEEVDFDKAVPRLQSNVIGLVAPVLE